MSGNKKIPEEKLVLVTSWDQLRDGDYVELKTCIFQCGKRHFGILGRENTGNVFVPNGTMIYIKYRSLLGAKCKGNADKAVTVRAVQERRVLAYRIIEREETSISLVKHY